MISHLVIVMVIHVWTKSGKPAVRLQDFSVRFLVPSHCIPILTRLGQSVTGVKAVKDLAELTSNLPTNHCIPNDEFLELFFLCKMMECVSCFVCSYMCYLFPTSDLFFCFLCVAGSIVYLGMMVGAFFWGGLADKVGRKQSLLICMSVNGFFAFLSSFVQGYGFFLLCRLLSGFG